MLSELILFVFSVYLFFISYQALKHKRLYWFAPTLVGFKNRKDKEELKGYANFIGVISLIFGIIMLMLFLKALLFGK